MTIVTIFFKAIIGGNSFFSSLRVSFPALHKAVCAGSVFTAFNTGFEHHGAFSTRKTLALDLAKHLFAINVVHLHMEGPALAREHLRTTLMRTAVVALTHEVVFLIQAFRVDTWRERTRMLGFCSGTLCLAARVYLLPCFDAVFIQPGHLSLKFED
jgi:hypothetical protein